MLLQSFRSRTNCETEARFIQNRIQFAEKSLSDLSNAFLQYSQKANRIRDKTDEISKTISVYAEGENINKTMRVALENFAESLSVLSDVNEKRVQALDTKIVPEVAKYKDICKHAKEEVKEIYSAREKELGRKKQLDRIREKNPQNRQQIIQAETELVKATARVSKSIHNLEEKTTTFEKQKLHDIKSTLLDFIAVEVAYHVNSLEVLTKAYDQIESIDEASDLEQFKKTLRLPGDTVYPKSPRRRSLFSSKSKFGSLGALFATSNKSTPSLSKSKDTITKSDETLNSPTPKDSHQSKIKHSLSEEDSDDSEESDSDLDITEDISGNSSDDEDNHQKKSKVVKIQVE